MPTSFFHQAHLKNWDVYNDILDHGDWATPWTTVVLTAANERQAEAYRYQLRVRDELGMLPDVTEFQVIPDPKGKRLGSGGATLHVLTQLAAQRPAAHPSSGSDGKSDAFSDARILIIHSGGDSRRLPQYSAFGKVFAPIPRLLKCGRPSTLFDELFAALVGVPARMNPGVVTASGDVLLLFDHSQLDMIQPGVTGVAIPVCPATATHHGVFVAQRGTRVRAFLHKPSEHELEHQQALRPDGNVAVDTGIVYMAADVAARLAELAHGEHGWLQRVADADCPVNFYGDFLMPLAPQTERAAYIADTSDGAAPEPLQALRADIWKKLRGTPMYVETLEPAKFLHFGTSEEFRCLVTVDDDDIRALGGRKRVSHVVAPSSRVHEAVCVLNSAVRDDASIAEGCVIEFCEIGERCRIEAGAIVSNTRLPAGVRVPARTVAHALPITVSDTAVRQFVLRVWGIDDDIKAPLPACTLFGTPLRDLLQQWDVPLNAIWPDATCDAQRTLWSARLFPAAPSFAEAWRASAPLFGQRQACADASAPGRDWLAQDRHSLESSFACADLEAVETFQQELFAKLVFEKCTAYFRQQRPVAQWFDKIPSRRDLGVLVRQMVAATPDIAPPLEQVRWVYSIAALLRAQPFTDRGKSGPARFESDAFKRLAAVMMRQHGQRALQLSAEQQQWKRDAVHVRLPVRIDFAGGWSDTPPHTLERGGTVLNAALTLDGICPVEVVLERLPDPVVRLESRDLQVALAATALSQLTDYDNPLDPLAIHKAAFCLFARPDEHADRSLPELLDRMGGGVSIRTEVAVPKGSGLGTSSSLAAALAKGLLLMSLAPDREPDRGELLAAASATEQMLTTGGGWQDQVGSLVPGLKLATTQPGLEQDVNIQPIPLPSPHRIALDERLVVVDTGQRRLARNLLREIMGRWLARDPATVEILADIRTLAVEAADALRAGAWSEAGQLLSKHWALNKELDPHTSNAVIEHTIAVLSPFLEGAKLAGAGGGGFLFGIAKEGAIPNIDTAIAHGLSAINVRRRNCAIFWGQERD